MINMPEFEIDDESVARAERLSSQLVDALRQATGERHPSEMAEVFSEQRYAEEAGETPIDDVLANVGQMAQEFAMARRWDGEVPCLKLQDAALAPISMAEFFGGSHWPIFGSQEWMEVWERYGRFPFSPHRFWREFVRRFTRGEEEVVTTNVAEAEEAVGPSLRDFLVFRFAGMKEWRRWIQAIGGQHSRGSRGYPPGTAAAGGTSPPPAVGAGGGLQVQVSCRTPGLRIHVSPAYFVTWRFFGSPSTPVTSYVLPGRYIFAGDGSMLPRLRRDNGVFCIPPNYHPALTRF